VTLFNRIRTLALVVGALTLSAGPGHRDRQGRRADRSATGEAFVEANAQQLWLALPTGVYWNGRQARSFEANRKERTP
jgi:hypothetical protein